MSRALLNRSWTVTNLWLSFDWSAQLVAKKWEAFANAGKRGQEVLSIVVSSASSERTFSLAGQTVPDQRTKLDPINVDKIVTLRANLWFLKQQNPIEFETEEEAKEREVTFKCFKVKLEVLKKNY